MESDLANLNLNDLEDGLVVGQQEIDEGDEDFRLCLVGKVLPDSSIHFPSLKIFYLNYGTLLKGLL